MILADMILAVVIVYIVTRGVAEDTPGRRLVVFVAAAWLLVLWTAGVWWAAGVRGALVAALMVRTWRVDHP